jgi:hypothetical protein
MDTSRICFIEGPPSTGKTFSIKTLNPANTFINSCTGKGLAWIGWQKEYATEEKKNYSGYYEAENILRIIDVVDKKPDYAHINTLILDDYQYSQSFGFLNDIKNKGYDKFNAVVENNYKIVKRLANCRSDLFIVIITHTERSTDINGVSTEKFKTLGKATDTYLEFDGLVSYILYASKELDQTGTKYWFYSEKAGTNARALYGAFKESRIANDLEAVRKVIMGIDN